MNDIYIAFWAGFTVGLIYYLTGMPDWMARQTARLWFALRRRRRTHRRGRYDLVGGKGGGNA